MTAEWTFGAGRKAPGGSVSTPPDVGVELHEDRQHAVVAAAGPGLDPLGHLALQHQRRVAQPPTGDMRGDQPEQDRRRDVVGEVARPRGAARRPSSSSADRHVEEVAVDQRDVRRQPAAPALPPSRGSISTAVRCATRGARRSVSAPGPGPISRNRSPGAGSIAPTSLSAHAGCEKVLAEASSRASATQLSSTDSPRQYFSSISSISSSLMPK